MKQGLTLSELAAKLETDKARQRDFVVDTREMHVLTSSGKTEVVLPGIAELAPSQHFLRQLGTDLGIRADMFDRLQSRHPAQFDHLVNGLLDRWSQDHDGKTGRRLVRTYVDGGPDGQGIARAVMSDQYRRIDNYDLAMAVLPIIGNIPDAVIASAAVTDSKMYLKVVAPLVNADLHELVQRQYGDGNLYDTGLKTGDVVQAGFVLLNSEVGSGALDLKQLIFRVACLNGLIGDSLVRRTHLGGRITAGDDGIAYRTETLAADDKALMMKVQDAVSSAVDEVRFAQLATQFAEKATGLSIEQPIAAMKVLAPTGGLNEDESNNVLKHLVAGGDLSQFGMVNAITRAAQDVDSYDRATELEALGGQVLNYNPTDWRTLATAAA